MKKLLLIAFVFSLVGTGAELLLLEHFEDWKQLIPLIVIGLGLLSVAWFAYIPSTSSTYFFRGVMICFIVSGILGFALHYNGNMAFELEMYPSLKGATLIWETLKGATPVLAPGALAATGLFGWAYSLS